MVALHLDGSGMEGSDAVISVDHKEEVLDSELEDLINQAGDTNKVVRKKALERLLKRFDEGFQGEGRKKVQDVALKALDDKAERCRELGCNLLLALLRSQGLEQETKGLLPFLLPLLASRLGGEEVQETSEEVKTKQLELLHLLLSPSTSGATAVYLADLVAVVTHCLQDPCPSVQRVGTVTRYPLSFLRWPDEL